MTHTFELRLDDGVGEPRRRLLTLESAGDLIRRVRDLMGAEPGVRAVEVRLAGASLFTLPR
ncbi:MAG TPA: hypothetical protein VGS12_17215 [Caulobacteraceae bacterium]|nr:hypothetical protein [Caulobacteraceae bacterium]